MAVRQMTFFLNLTFSQIDNFPKIIPHQSDVTLNFPCVTGLPPSGVWLDFTLSTDLIWIFQMATGFSRKFVFKEKTNLYEKSAS